MIKNYYLGGFGMSEIRDKKIEVRLTEAEKALIRINKITYLNYKTRVKL